MSPVRERRQAPLPVLLAAMTSLQVATAKGPLDDAWRTAERALWEMLQDSVPLSPGPEGTWQPTSETVAAATFYALHAIQAAASLPAGDRNGGILLRQAFDTSGLVRRFLRAIPTVDVVAGTADPIPTTRQYADATVFDAMASAMNAIDAAFPQGATQALWPIVDGIRAWEAQPGIGWMPTPASAAAATLCALLGARPVRTANTAEASQHAWRGARALHVARDFTAAIEDICQGVNERNLAAIPDSGGRQQHVNGL